MDEQPPLAQLNPLLPNPYASADPSASMPAIANGQGKKRSRAETDATSPFDDADHQPVAVSAARLASPTPAARATSPAAPAPAPAPLKTSDFQHAAISTRRHPPVFDASSVSSPSGGNPSDSTSTLLTAASSSHATDTPPSLDDAAAFSPAASMESVSTAPPAQNVLATAAAAAAAAEETARGAKGGSPPGGIDGDQEGREGPDAYGYNGGDSSNYTRNNNNNNNNNNGDGGHNDDDNDPEADLWEEQAAVQQAEEGSIVVDSDELGTDDGYGSDNNTTASTSLAESVRDYIYENGRRYHRFREGRYNFPNDDVEQQREDMKHAMVKMLCGQLYFAPIGDHPHEILDIGTGTGIWAIEMGDLFPAANVLGVDLSPIQPEWVPPNVRFMVDDVESPWLHPRNYFDYIHSRHTVMAIKDWPKLMRRALEHMRPGGWFEMQEVHHYPISANASMPPDHPVAEYWRLIYEGLTNLGVNFYASANGQLAEMMREAGFVNVTERVLQIPIGTWAKNKVLKTVGLYWRTILLDGISAIALGPLTRGCGWTREQVEAFLVDVRKGYHDNSMLAYMPLHIVYGQKPHGY
ncbi:hypothetical protein VTJ83DRAFT_1823 [Remersonia thermophila]|uniref:Methyltransferase domain-containing protein n=1 Tax=Remersonia thermophila TaxID=72144 RepID=A0ABR4DJA1_9PEZI